MKKERPRESNEIVNRTERGNHRARAHALLLGYRSACAHAYERTQRCPE